MYADAAGARICYDASGEGEPVVMIAGFGACRGYWSRAPSALPGYRIVSMDNRGVGDTEYSGRFSMEDMADDVVAVMDSEGIGKAHVVGWSMGSLIARSLAIRYPDRLADLTLIGTYLERPARSEYVLDGMVRMVADGEASMKAFYSVVNAFCFSERVFRRFAEKGHPVPLPKEDQDVGGLMDQLVAIAEYDERRTDTDIRVPTLVIHGSEDIMVPPSEGRRIADMIEGSRFLLLDGEGHGISPDVYARQLIGFMREHPIGG